MQRQRLPSSPQRIASSLVASPCSISETAASTIPGVQKPHWRACWSWKACWTGWNAPFVREPLDRRDLRAVGLDAEDGARLHGLAVDEHRARAARGRVATDVRAGQAEPVAEDVDEQLARLELELVPRPVDGQRNVSHAMASLSVGSST